MTGNIIDSNFEINTYLGTDFEQFHTDFRFVDNTAYNISVVDLIININQCDARQESPNFGALRHIFVSGLSDG